MYFCFGQDKEVESYFQEVMAVFERSVEEGSKGEERTLSSRLQELYQKIVSDSNSGTSLSVTELQKHVM